MLLVALARPCPAQTTQGLLAGQVFDQDTGQPVANAVVEYARREQGIVVETGSGRTNSTGSFAFSFLPPDRKSVV